MVGCASSPGYVPPNKPTDYEFVVLATDAMSNGLATELATQRLRVRRVLTGGRRATAAVEIFEFEGVFVVLAVDTRSGGRVATISLGEETLPADPTDAGRQLARVLAQAIHRPDRPRS